MNELLMLFLSLSISGTIIATTLFLLKPLIKDMPFTLEVSVVGELFERIGAYIISQEAGNHIALTERTISSNDMALDSPEIINSQMPTFGGNEATKKSTILIIFRL